MTAGALLLALLAADARVAATLQNCDALYYGRGRPQDYARALTCYRAGEDVLDWIMVAIMQLNGDGTPVDVAGARASLAKSQALYAKAFGSRPGPKSSGDHAQLDAIIEKREANPKVKGPRVDFCEDVAGTTQSINDCEAEKLARANKAEAARLGKVRGRLEAALRTPFDRTVAAFGTFVRAESRRAYQQYIAGSIRNQFAMDQETLVRANFDALIKLLTSADEAAPPSASRPFADADRELNDVYREKVRSYAAENEEMAVETKDDPATAATYRQNVADYKEASRAAQRAWVRYRDAAGKLAAAKWPDVPGVEDAVRARVTEDRIRELRNGLEG